MITFSIVDQRSREDPYQQRKHFIKNQHRSYNQNIMTKTLITDNRRECTDIICCILMLLFCLSLFILAIFFSTLGSHSNWDIPFDPDGRPCGQKENLEHPYIYFASPHADSLWVTTCLKRCPNSSEQTELECSINSVVATCKPQNNADSAKAVQIYETNVCTSLCKIEKMNVCMPVSEKLREKIKPAIKKLFFQQLFGSIKRNISILAILLPLTIALGLVFLLFLRIGSGFFIYILLVLGIGVFLGFGIYMFIPTGQSSHMFVLKKNKIVSYIVGGISILIALIIFLIFCCNRSRVRLASSLLMVASDFVSDNCLIVILPIVVIGVMVIFVVCWLLIFLSFYSANDIASNGTNRVLPFQRLQLLTIAKILIIFHIFFFIWFCRFIVHTCDFIASGAAKYWYFNKRKCISKSVRVFFQYHIGSVCLGSYFSAFLGGLKIIYETLIPSPHEQYQNGCMRCFSGCCNCLCCLCSNYLFSCFNSWSYSYMHLTGKNYCMSSWEAMEEVKKERIASIVVSRLFQIFEILVTLSLTIVLLLLTNKLLSYSESNFLDRLPILIGAAIISLSTFQIFLSVYSQPIQAIYMCFIYVQGCEDIQKVIPSKLKQFLKEAELQGENLDPEDES